MLEQRLEQVQRRLSEGVKAQAEASQRVALIERSDGCGRTAHPSGRRPSAGGRGPLGPAQEERRRQTDEARAASGQLDELRRGRAVSERQLGELAEHQRRTEIGEAETRTRLEAAVEHVRRERTPSRPPQSPPSSRRCRTGSRRWHGCGTSSVRCASWARSTRWRSRSSRHSRSVIGSWRSSWRMSARPAVTCSG